MYGLITNKFLAPFNYVFKHYKLEEITGHYLLKLNNIKMVT